MAHGSVYETQQLFLTIGDVEHNLVRDVDELNDQVLFQPKLYGVLFDRNIPYSGVFIDYENFIF